MMATTVAITNMVLCLMVRTPNTSIDSHGDFRLGVNTQYIHSVTIHPLDKIYSSRCIFCNKELWYEPQDFLGALPCRMDFRVEDLKNSRRAKHKAPYDYACSQCCDGACVIDLGKKEDK